MADNVTLNPGAAGDSIRTKDRGTTETQIVGLDLGIGGSETLMNGSMPITAAALPLPAGASTAAKQPALGTAGAASADVLTVQGAASMTPVQVDSELTTADLDTGVGTDTRAVVGLIVAKSGGAANVSATDPLPVVVGSTVPVQIQGGANQIGKLAANSGVDIGDVDVTTVPGTVADNAVGLPAVIYVVGGYDGTNVQALTTNAAGNLQVGLSAAIPAGANAIGSVTVTGTPAVDTELPAAAALADGAANPTTPSTGANGLLWNGATWDRAKGDTTNGAFVNVKAMIALPAGSALIGRTNVEPQTANGLSIFHLVSAATTNLTNIKAGAGQVYGWYIYNSNAAARKVVFHNNAGSPTAGAGVIFSLVIPPGSASNVPMDMGLTFATGIAISTVTGLADSDTTAVAANDLIINIFYK